MNRKAIELLAMIAVVSITALPASAAPPANAGSPTCSGAPLGDHGSIRVHGEHVIEDYVTEGERGARGGPAHFTFPAEIGPGASFCLEQAQSQSPTTPPGRQ